MTREAYFNFFSGDGPDEAELKITRDDRAGLFFSIDALDEANDWFVGFIGGRLMKYHGRTGQTPHTMTLTVKIDLEG